MRIRLIIRLCAWLLLFPLLAGCGPDTTPVVATFTPVVTVDMNALSTQAVGTFVAQMTQTAYVTPTETLLPTRTPYPTETPAPVYDHDGKIKASIVNGNLYVQAGDGENVQRTNQHEDHDPFFSDDGKKILFYRGYGDNFINAIDTTGGKEQEIISVPLLAVQDGAQIKGLTFLKNTHILVFNIYVCGRREGMYTSANCFVSTYSVDADSGKSEEIGQRVSGIGFDDRNFEISPNQKYLSIAGSGHINIFSFSSGHFTLAYLGAFAYSMTRVNEFLPYQFWLPDSSGLMIVAAGAGTSNGPPDPPSFYDVFRYLLGKKAVQMDGIHPELGEIWRMGCIVSFSPDRNWMFYMDGTIKLRNLKEGSSHSYPLGGELPCYAIVWSPDSKHFGIINSRYGQVGSVDAGSLTTLPGSFNGWIDATHYSYTVGDNVKNLKEYIAEIGGDSVLVLTPTPTPTPQ